jgi:hypothetical protein
MMAPLIGNQILSDAFQAAVRHADPTIIFSSSGQMDQSQPNPEVFLVAYRRSPVRLLPTGV